MADAALEFHLPQAVLCVHVAEAEQRVHLARGEDVGNGVCVANDLDRPAGVFTRRERGDAVDDRQRAPRVAVQPQAGGGREQQEQHRQYEQSSGHAWDEGS